MTERRSLTVIAVFNLLPECALALLHCVCVTLLVANVQGSVSPGFRAAGRILRTMRVCYDIQQANVLLCFHTILDFADRHSDCSASCRGGDVVQLLLPIDSAPSLGGYTPTRPVSLTA